MPTKYAEERINFFFLFIYFCVMNERYYSNGTNKNDYHHNFRITIKKNQNKGTQENVEM